MSQDVQSAKRTVRAYQQALENCAPEAVAQTLAAHTSPDYRWRSMHPFHEQDGVQAVADVFWKPLRAALSAMQRREDVFIAGYNDVDNGDSLWVLSMGHMMGLFDAAWLGIPPTRRMAFLPYAEFHRVEDERIMESAFFCDIISVMRQAGHYPLPPQTGAALINPGPRTHDGILDDEQDVAESEKTMAVVKQLIEDLRGLNEGGDDRCPPSVLERTWHEDIIWYGPAGIGATYTIDRYQEQHQYPFRCNLKNKQYNGHVARLAEGHYGGFFGWANLTNTPTGGFLGLPGNEVRADMRVVDVYRRDGDKLSENWVFIDLLHYLSMQGLDILGRLRELQGAD